MRKHAIVEVPESINCEAGRLCMQLPHRKRRTIEYQELIMAYIVLFDREKKEYWIPDFEAVSEEMRGCLILYDRKGQHYNIYTSRTGKREGAVLLEIALNMPYVILGYHPWLRDRDEQEFEYLMQMMDCIKQSEAGDETCKEKAVDV